RATPGIPKPLCRPATPTGLAAGASALGSASRLAAAFQERIRASPARSSGRHRGPRAKPVRTGRAVVWTHRAGVSAPPLPSPSRLRPGGQRALERAGAAQTWCSRNFPADSASWRRARKNSVQK
ncbi:Hypothetical predicted protein, partial [Marmota monax]